MALIECIPGPAETFVGGITYVFEMDQYGRHVAEVHSIEHMACLLAVVHYRQVPDVPEEFVQEKHSAPTPAMDPIAVPAANDPALNAQPGLVPPTPAVPAPVKKKPGGRPPKSTLVS